MGGMIAAIEAGFPQTEIAAASYRYQREIEAGERTIVGVNRFQSRRSADRTAADRRNQRRAARWRNWRPCARGAIMARCERPWMRCSAPPKARRTPCRYMLDAVRAYATLGEICDALRGVFGTYQETSHI